MTCSQCMKNMATLCPDCAYTVIENYTTDELRKLIERLKEKKAREDKKEVLDLGSPYV